MKYLGPISDPKDLVNKEYVDGHGGGGGEHVELTQAEYDALSQAEKTNGTVYFITDADPEVPAINDSVPIGAIQAYGGSTAPFGWLICDGSEVRRDTYWELFDVIGTTYGSGDGSTTFNIPDLRGRVGVGSNSSYALGSSGGEATHTLTMPELPGRTVVRINTGFQSSGGLTGGSNVSSGTYATGCLDDSLEYGSNNDRPHNNMQPYVVTNYIIKAKEKTLVTATVPPLITDFIDVFYPVGSYYESSDASFNPNASWGGTWVLETSGQVHVSAGTGYTIGSTGGEATHTLTENEMPSHTHGINFPTQNGDAWGYYGGGGAGGWGLNGNGNNNNYGRQSNKNTGGSQPHNNMQPYIVVNRWHRTA